MRFIVIMIVGYTNPSVEEVNFNFFTEDRGFTVEHRRTIGFLNVGSHNTFLEGTYQFTVKRVI